MSVYDNDRRVRVEPVCGTCRLVKTMFFGEVAVVQGDDGVFLAFEYEQGQGRSGSVSYRLGDELNVPEGDFDSVVHALIGNPQ